MLSCRMRSHRILPQISLLLVCAASAGSAQDAPEVERQYQPDEVPTCSVASASRTREACDEPAAQVRTTERELTRTFAVTAPDLRQCEVVIENEYYQRDTIVRLNSVITNEDCAASNGEFDIELQLEDADGETQRLVFHESWQRGDDRAVEFMADYPIGDNVELVRLRSRALSCTCIGE